MGSLLTWQELDHFWMTSMLQRNGLDVKVKSVKAGPVGTGQTGDCIRFVLDYEKSVPSAPVTLVGKFPAEGESSRQAGVMFGSYIREVKFYQILQSRTTMSTPKVYHAELDDKTHDFILIMEDLSPAKQGDQIAGVTVEQAKFVAAEAAKLHGAFWKHAELNEIPWVFGSVNFVKPYPDDIFLKAWPTFLERYGDRISDQAKKIGDVYVANADKYEELRKGGDTLIHLDFRPDNMMFASDEGGKSISVVDWQSFSYGPAASDLGFFLAGAISAEERRQHEGEILDIYKQGMESLGVTDYHPDLLRQHYLMGAVQLFRTAYAAAVMVSQTDRGDTMFLSMLNGAVDLITDHNALSLFD